MNNKQILKIYSNKKNHKYNSLIQSILKNKHALKHNNVKVKVIKTNFELVSELYDYNNKIIYRTRNPNMRTVFEKLKTTNLQMPKSTNIKMHPQYSKPQSISHNFIKQGGHYQKPINQHLQKPINQHLQKPINQHLQNEINQVDKYSNHKHSSRKAHHRLENEINDSMSQNVNKKMSVYVKNTDNGPTNYNHGQIKGGQMSIFVKPVVKDDSYKYDEEGNFIKGLGGIGYKNAKKAEQTIKQIEELYHQGKITSSKQLAVILKMYYRAKKHRYQTEDMRGAIRVYKEWIKRQDYDTEQDN